MLDFREIDLGNGVGHIGYWLGKEFNGNRFMTTAVKEMVSVGFNDLGLNRLKYSVQRITLKVELYPSVLVLPKKASYEVHRR